MTNTASLLRIVLLGTLALWACGETPNVAPDSGHVDTGDASTLEDVVPPSDTAVDTTDAPETSVDVGPITVTVAVVDALTREALSGAEVRVQLDDGTVIDATTDEFGAAGFAAGDLVGRAASFTAWKHGYEALSVVVEYGGDLNDLALLPRAFRDSEDWVTVGGPVHNLSPDYLNLLVSADTAPRVQRLGLSLPGPEWVATVRAGEPTRVLAGAYLGNWGWSGLSMHGWVLTSLNADQVSDGREFVLDFDESNLVPTEEFQLEVVLPSWIDMDAGGPEVSVTARIFNGRGVSGVMIGWELDERRLQLSASEARIDGEDPVYDLVLGTGGLVPKLLYVRTFNHRPDGELIDDVPGPPLILPETGDELGIGDGLFIDPNGAVGLSVLFGEPDGDPLSAFGDVFWTIAVGHLGGLVVPDPTPGMLDELGAGYWSGHVETCVRTGGGDCSERFMLPNRFTLRAE